MAFINIATSMRCYLLLMEMTSWSVLKYFVFLMHFISQKSYMLYTLTFSTMILLTSILWMLVFQSHICNQLRKIVHIELLNILIVIWDQWWLICFYWQVLIRLKIKKDSFIGLFVIMRCTFLLLNYLVEGSSMYLKLHTGIIRIQVWMIDLHLNEKNIKE